jgi:16S rRNA (uracil1498-N3)-methyltransferase
MRRFFASPANFANGIVTLSDEETRHLRDVLRLRVGDDAAVFDGAGKEFRCEVKSIGKRSSELSVINAIDPASPESPLSITLAAAILKHDRFDLVVQKAVELGITRLTPLEVVRSDVRAQDAVKRIDRWRRIAMEATKQCGRARLMDIDQPCKFTDVVAAADPRSTIMFSERDGGSLPESIGSDMLTAVIGPVGGWDDSELHMAKSKRLPIVTLGGRILRAETAAISIATVLQHRFGDFN